MIATERLPALFVEVADTWVDDFDIIEFLHSLTMHAAAVSGAEAVGLMLADSRGRLRFMASSNETGRTLELLQLQNDEGPCLDCVTTGTPVVNADLTHAGDRWPVFAPRAIEAGFQSVHAFPMRLRHKVIGALNLFGTQDAHFAPDEVRVVQALADVATIAILHQRTLIQADVVTEQLQAALDSRIVIEQAKGALAQAEGISPAQAFDLMRSRARSNRKLLGDVAQEALTGLESHGPR